MELTEGKVKTQTGGKKKTKPRLRNLKTTSRALDNSPKAFGGGRSRMFH